MKIIRKVKTFKDFLFFIWELPQNLLDLFIIWIIGAWYSVAWKDCYFTKKIKIAVSLGNYIILNSEYYNNPVKIGEEKELQKLSRKTGWFYLIVVLIIKWGK